MEARGFMRTTPKPNYAGASLLILLVVSALGVVFYVFPPWEVATDAPSKARHSGMAQLPVVIWWIGSGLLAIALIYGIIRTGHRSKMETVRSEEATKRLYEKEEKDRK
jgi:hypothetical protein